MATTQETIRFNELRNVRYGEIFLISPGDEGGLRADVYNTTGLNDCPQEKWSPLDPQTLTRDTGASAVWLNGPRFWLMDRITAYKAGEVRSFQGLQARWLAVLSIPAGFELSGSGPGRFYQDTVINRDTEWLFSAGKPVHELLDSEGRVYVTHHRVQPLTMDMLAGLGDRLQLPAGWAYRTETPEHDLVLRTATGEAHILQDELENTYTH
ncbi:hypothetical protein [Streptomyces sp. NPDC001450]